MWVFAYEVNKTDSKWILYGEVIRKWKYPDEDRFEVFMQDELFYGEGDQVADGQTEGWQQPNPNVGYTISGNHIYETQEEAQHKGIKALFIGKIF